MLSHTSPDKSSLLLPAQVVGSVISPEALRSLDSLNINILCDVVEFRADGFPAGFDGLPEAMDRCPLPALLTVRRPDEGGLNALSPADRQARIEALLPHARLLDLEIASLPDFPAVLSQAQALGIPVIASLHDFTGTPDKDALEAAAERAMGMGAAAVKFATTLRRTADLATLMALQEESAVPMATMGMGPMGRVSRLLLANLGSVLNYGYLDRPTVPGQWPAGRLRELIRELKGE
ncbi:MAG: type I 3-dehydroquinate dehydratase [Verrucomicrobiaceae bacterium]|nr:MAG: type I 3-dehydroquinate dehydratase [Verrucomicrobiaceae bacterium]